MSRAGGRAQTLQEPKVAFPELGCPRVPLLTRWLRSRSVCRCQVAARGLARPWPHTGLSRSTSATLSEGPFCFPQIWQLLETLSVVSWERVPGEGSSRHREGRGLRCHSTPYGAGQLPVPETRPAPNASVARDPSTHCPDWGGEKRGQQTGLES